MNAFAVLLAASLHAAPAPKPVDRIVGLLGEKKCDEAFLAISEVPVPPAPAAADAAGARALARGAAGCREEDPLVALALTTLAHRLAPGDPAVLVVHAETLAAAQQKGEAAALLDAAVKAQPAKAAPGVWFLRARLAHEDGDDARALEALRPLLALPEWKAKAAALTDQALQAQRRRREEQQALEAAAGGARPAAGAAPVEAKPLARQASGTVIAHLPGYVGLHGSREFEVTGLVPGQGYLFRAEGACHRPPWEVREAFGIDFRVQFGDGPSHALSLGQGRADDSKVAFVATGPLMSIRVFDDSSVERDVRCWVGRFSVVAQ